MNIKIDFDNIKVKETRNDFTVKLLMLKGEKGDTGAGSIWGEIEGDITTQTDLIDLIETDLEDYYTKVESNARFKKIYTEEYIREERPNDNYFSITSGKLTGLNKSSRTSINQLENKECCVEVNSNENLVENIRLTNTNNYENKTAIKVNIPSQRNKFDSIFIDSNFKYGMQIPKSFYSQFNDIWYSGETGILIGDPNKSWEWIGVLDFNACHFNGSKIGIKQVATDTNTICIDKSSFEGDEVAVDNIGKMYFRNTYFGDTPSVSEKINVLIARAGSETHFDNCTIGITAVANDNTDEKVCSLFNLKSDSTKGSEVHVNGGILNLSNNNATNCYSAIYESDSDKNLLFLDDVKFIPPSGNTNHNLFPYKVYNYTPLRSKKPIKNYIINGTMKNPVMNDVSLDVDGQPNVGGYVENLVNPFGGKIYEYTKATTSDAKSMYFFYKIPKKLIGKQMTLECYLYDGSDNQLRISSSSLGLNNEYPYVHSTRINDENRTRIVRYNVTPTSEVGSLFFDYHWSVTNSKMRIFGVVLKEKCYKDYISCYEDQDIMISSKIPTNTVDAVKGNIVYSTPGSSNTGEGWIFNGTSWVVYNSYS